MAAVRELVTLWLLTALRWCLRVLHDVEAWLAPPVIVPGVSPPVTPSLSPIDQAAQTWVQWAAQTYPDQSGEYKRHKVLAKLMKTCPDIPARDLGMAIEQAVQKELV